MCMPHSLTGIQTDHGLRCLQQKIARAVGEQAAVSHTQPVSTSRAVKLYRKGIIKIVVFIFLN